MRSSIPEIRKTAARLREVLLAPSLESIDAIMPALQQAAAALQHSASLAELKDARADLEALAREWRGAARLAAQGLDLTRGTLHILAAAASAQQPASYQSDGEPAPLHPHSTVMVTG